MSRIIYTISHPFTNEVVYVGCTSNFESRKLSYLRKHEATRPIDFWIENLKLNYILPKIEILSETDSENVFEDEMFWIRMLKSWGFNLLNVFKVNPPKDNLYSTNPNCYTGNPKIRKSKKWELGDFDIGKTYQIENIYSKRNSFYTVFRAYAKIFGLIRFLRFTTINDSTLLAEVVEEKILKGKVAYVKKGYAKAIDRKSYNNTFDPLKIIGNSIEVLIKNETDFKTLKCKLSYHLRNIKPKRMNYVRLNTNTIKIIRIY